MKKVFFSFYILIICVCLASCGANQNNNNSSHEHNYSTEWSMDDEYHWHNATCEHEDEVIDKEKHTFIDGICICGKKNDLEIQAREIMNNMTLEQKIGQMFMVSPDWTSYNNALDCIKNYHFGNIIYMTPSVSNKTKIASLSDGLQKQMIEQNGIAGFISIDQEGGRVNRLSDGGTRFVSSLAIAATNDPANAYKVGDYVGYELKNYGINCDLTPVMDVNKNPDNPSIGIRSYGDDPNKVRDFSTNMFLGLKNQNVLSCAKHFPGYGDTNLDSHDILPTVTSSKEVLLSSELLPYVNAIDKGLDAIMTGHIIYSALDKDYPATLSKKIVQDLLRDELGYDGLIITDALEMGAIKNYYGSFDKTSVLAVKAGCDILLYTDMNNPKTAYNGLLGAVKNNDISVDRIEESVLRIICMKLKYGINDYKASNKNIEKELKEHEEFNQELADSALTLVKGEYSIKPSEKVLIVSSSTTYNPGYNSFSEYATKILKEKGYNVTSKVVSDNITTNEYNDIMNIINEFDKVIIALSNVGKFHYDASKRFVNEVSSKLKDDLLVIALFNPYDILAYSDISNYICVYCDQLESHNALIKYLMGELTPKGVLPVRFE